MLLYCVRFKCKSILNANEMKVPGNIAWGVSRTSEFQNFPIKIPMRFFFIVRVKRRNKSEKKPEIDFKMRDNSSILHELFHLSFLFFFNAIKKIHIKLTPPKSKMHPRHCPLDRRLRWRGIPLHLRI